MNDKICGYYLDNEQLKIVLDESKYVLVTAGAGSGKTMTILGKINYLVKYKKIKPEEILCISFTRDSSRSLKNKIRLEFNIDIDVYTFHKLSLNILKDFNIKFDIAPSNALLECIDEFIYKDVQTSKIHMKIILKYMGERYKNNSSYLKYINKNKDKVKLLEKLILTFISLFKCNNYELKDLNDDKERADVCGISVDEIRKGVLGIFLSDSIEEAKKKAQAIYKRGQWPRFFFTKKGTTTSSTISLISLR